MRILIAFILTTLAAHAQNDSAHFQNVLFLGRTYVNDHAIIHASGAWHLLYTSGDMSIRPWMSPGNEVEIGHAVSTDLVEWRSLAPALRIGPKGARDGEHVYAPSVVADGDRFVMHYTGNERGFFSGEQILAATSTDLTTWTKLADTAVFLPDSSRVIHYPPGYDSGRGGPMSFRDPFVLRDPTHGWIMYYVARLRRDSSGVDSACVAAATSRDLVTWVDRGPVLTRPVMGQDVNPYTHPESPCVVVRDGRWVLFWKGGSGTRYVWSDDPLDFTDGQPRLLSTSHASKVFEWNDRWYVTSCSRDVNDVMHTRSDRTRGLFIAGLEWDGEIARVTAMPAPAAIDADVDDIKGDASLRPNVIDGGGSVSIAGVSTGSVELVDMLGRARVLPVVAGGVRIDGAATGIFVLRTRAGVLGRVVVR